MAFINGGYTTSKNILKDLANIFTSANKVLDPQVKDELHKVADMTIKLRHNPIAETTFTFKKDDVAITPVYEVAGKNITFTSGVSDDDVITVTYNGDKDWELVYPAQRDINEDDPQNPITLTTDEEKRADQLSQILANNRFVIRTTTTTVTPDIVDDPFNTDPGSTTTELTMFVEFEKPEYCINPETGNELTKTMTENGWKMVKLKNNHFINVRMVDKFDIATGTVPEDAIPSEWSKFSWFMDFREELVDDYDKTPVKGDSAKGVFLRPLSLPPFYDNGNLAIQYWISINNDRINMVLMGNPDISYDDYLISYAYIGKIDSFKDKVTGKVYSNDVLGNFALTVGSSTIPCMIPGPAQAPIANTGKIKEYYNGESLETDKGIHSTGDAFNRTALKNATTGAITFRDAKIMRLSYMFTFYNDEVESLPIPCTFIAYKELLKMEEAPSTTLDPQLYDGTYMLEPNIVIQLPEEFKENIKGLKVYKYAGDIEGIYYGGTIAAPILGDPFYKVDDIVMTEEIITAGEIVWQDRGALSVVTPNVYLAPVSERRLDPEYKPGVVRDGYTGTITTVNFPETYGIGTTGTGVSDITMFQTRMGAYYQKHYSSFVTPDEFMRKENFNPSKWTGRFHLSNIYVCHGGDGYRGFLQDVVMVDNTNIVNTDVLIVNEGSTDPANPEVKYKYFKLNTPFSFINTSANYAYGIGIKMV